MTEFRLAALLRLRRLREDQTRVEATRARSRASELSAERHQLLGTLSDHGHDARDVRDITAISVARASTSVMLSDLQALQHQQDEVLRGADEAHRAARREVRTVERLEERHADSERLEAQRAEQVVLDEIAARARSAVRGAGPDGGRS
jgi:flagellar FliJ protein